MEGEARVHIVVITLVLGLVGLVVLFWTSPQLIIYGLLGLAAVLAYGALYLIVAAWVDPKPPPGPLPQDGGSEHSTVIAPSDDQPTRMSPRVAEDAETQTKMALEDAPTEAAEPRPKKNERRASKKRNDGKTASDEARKKDENG